MRRRPIACVLPLLSDSRTALRSPLDRTRPIGVSVAASRLPRWWSDLNREEAATRPGIAQGPVLSIGGRYAARHCSRSGAIDRRPLRGRRESLTGE